LRIQINDLCFPGEKSQWKWHSRCGCCKDRHSTSGFILITIQAHKAKNNPWPTRAANVKCKCLGQGRAKVATHGRRDCGPRNRTHFFNSSVFHLGPPIVCWVIVFSFFARQFATLFHLNVPSLQQSRHTEACILSRRQFNYELFNVRNANGIRTKLPHVVRILPRRYSRPGNSGIDWGNGNWIFPPPSHFLSD